MRRLSKVNSVWSAHLAYAIGLIATDGCLSKNGRSINFTSKDKQLVVLFKHCLNVNNKIGRKKRNQEKEKKYYYVQVGDKNFYEFLLNIGLTPAKSKTIGPLKIPPLYFSDFFRGSIDGDGSIGIFYHPESVHPQLQLRLYSASIHFLQWIKQALEHHTKVKGGWIAKMDRVFALRYAKEDAIKLLKFMYYADDVPCLRRKYMMARPFLGTILKFIESLHFTSGIATPR